MKEYLGRQNKQYDWIVLPEIYFAISRLCCEKILRSKGVEFSNSILKELNFKSPHANYELIFPIVYNFKHGIELYLKGLGNYKFGVYKQSHDLKELFDFIINKDKEKGKNNFKNLYDLTWIVIKKYYYGTYMPSVKDKNFSDKKNEAERYPEYKNAYKILEPYKWVNKKQIFTINEDIKNVEKFFNKMLCKM
jgi:HEPN domain-containing protein